MKRVVIDGRYLGKIPPKSYDAIWEALMYVTTYYEWEVRVHGLRWRDENVSV